MKIKKAGDLILIESNKAKIAFPLVENAKITEGIDILLLDKPAEVNAEKTLVISSAGEYETNDVFVYALANKADEVDIYAVDIEGINVIFFNSDAPIDKLFNSEFITENNILICNVRGGEVSKIADVVDEIDPNAFILVGDTPEKLVEIIKKLSLTSTSEAQSNYSFVEDQFDSELETPMQILLLK
jgi:hypothetical protein